MPLLLLSSPATAPPAATARPAPSGTIPPVATPVLPTTPSAVPPGDTVTAGERAAWQRVAICEEGGKWNFRGSLFSGGLGISQANWAAYGGQRFAYDAADATPDQQIMVAQRIQFDPPDQYGCRGW